MTSKTYKPGPRHAYVPAPTASLPTADAKPVYKNELLNERNKTHGDFLKNASVSQQIKHFMRETQGWRDLTCDQWESLDMMALKISRILSGNPNEPDHWEDIAGYANLISESLRRDK